MTNQGHVFKVNKTAKQLDRDVMKLRGDLLETIASSGHNVGVAADALIFAIAGICEVTSDVDFNQKVSARVREFADLLDAANKDLQ